jgi:hypothetical protein
MPPPRIWLWAVVWVGHHLAAQAPITPPVALAVQVPSRVVYVGERVPITLRLELEAAFLAERAVPLFQQPLDLPVAVEAGWLVADAQHQVEVADAAGGRAVATAGARRSWRQVDAEGGRLEFELAVDYLPLAPGRHELGAAVRYAFATAFTEHFLRGREPVDRQEASASVAAASLTVEPVPENGRPAAWSGLVGRGEVQARAEAAAVALGETLTVVLTCAGRCGAVPGVRAPWPELPGFVVLGCIERATASAHTFAYDLLAVRATATAVPPLPLVLFDPEARAYRTLASAPQPVQILPARAPLPERIAALVAADAAAERAAAAWPAWWYGFLAGVAAGLGLLLRRHLGARHRRAVRNQAVRVLAQALPGPPETAAAAFAALLQLGPELAAVPPPLAAELARCQQQLDAARFGGPRPDPAWVLAQGAAFAALRVR